MTLSVSPYDMKRATRLATSPISDLSPSEVDLIDRAACAVTKTLTDEKGMSSSELSILLFNIHRADDIYTELLTCAHRIIQSRSYPSEADKKLIAESADMITGRLIKDGAKQDELGEIEREVLFRWQQLLDRDGDGVSTTVQTQESLLPGQSRTSLAALSQLAGASDFRAGAAISDLGSSTRAGFAKYIRDHPSEFSTVSSSSSNDTAQQNDALSLPTLPAYGDLKEGTLPDDLDEIEREIQQRLRDESEASLFLIRNRGVLWRLKMKRNKLRGKKE